MQPGLVHARLVYPRLMELVRARLVYSHRLVQRLLLDAPVALAAYR